MGLIDSLWERHQFLMHQCILLPFALLFCFLSKRGYLSLTCRYVFVSVGGCVLAVVTMGAFSLLPLVSASAFVLLLCSVDSGSVHSWALGLQMLWQTFWHLLIQYREYYLQEPVSTRLFVAVSSLMLLTQRITSLSMDVQEQKVPLPSNAASTQSLCAQLLPLISYVFSFTSLLGGPLCPYRRFVSHMEALNLHSPPCPRSVLFLKLAQVFMLELLKHCLVRFMKQSTCDPSSSVVLCGVLWTWALALVLRIQYYSHWRISECLSHAAGFGFGANSCADSPDWSSISDGDFWTTEASTRVSEFARRWNATTASWLRRLVYIRCKRFPLLMTFGFSLWWHGLHFGHFVGFLTWAACVKADYFIHRHLYPQPSGAGLKLLYTCLCWINTQMIITFIVIAVELRNLSSLKLLIVTYVGLFPLCNIIYLFVCSFHAAV
ncbi:ghrelin O-acyltransferase [Betta splendens]|uniref:Ghrelin O-acyltransferase n=1 Tax=Betta splendens TaxID=158456 RepID=A0A6P7NPV4_BETSP|nr:ghrelin O-acyltransferase [Betta splendens]